MKALVNYLMCRGLRKTWPASKNSEFWASFIADCSPDHNKRTGRHVDLNIMFVVTIGVLCRKRLSQQGSEYTKEKVCIT